MGPWTAGKIFLSTAISKELEKQKKKQPPPEERILGVSPPAGLPNQTNELNPLHIIGKRTNFCR
jgi:hypothetical protein